MNEEDILDQVDRHRQEFLSMENGHHTATRAFLARTVTFVHKIRQQPDAITAFFKHQYFEGRVYALKKDELLRYYFLCTMNAKQGTGKYERACNYAVSLSYLLEEEFLNEKEVVGAIDEAGGMEDLYRDQVARKKIAKIGFSKLEIEGGADVLDHLFGHHVGSRAPIVLERVEDGLGGWKRFRLVSEGD